jgi:hypothetical protein
VTRAVFRFEDVTLAPDREPDAEPITYAMQCAVCEEESAASEETEPVQDWVFQHAGAHPGHHSYREIITRPYRAVRIGRR